MFTFSTAILSQIRNTYFKSGIDLVPLNYIGGHMKRLILILSLVFVASVSLADEYDVRNRQGCIDELKTEVDKVCSPAVQNSQSSIMGMLKNAGFIAQTDSRVRRVCSYHCPQDIAAKCHALLGRGPSILQDVFTGKVNVMSAYAEGCKALQGRIETAQKEINDMSKDLQKTKQASQLVEGSFRKPSSAPVGQQVAAKPAKCNPYNESGSYVMGKCP